MKKAKIQIFIYSIFLFISSSSAGEVSPYGICSHISRHGDHELADGQLKLMAEGGIAWARTDFDWSGVQKGPGDNWDFSMLDRTVSKAEQAGIKVLPILAYDVPWASPAYKHLDQWLEYVRRTVTRYKDRLRYWEVWNEPDGAGFWYDKPDPVQYATLLKATYTEIKKIDPELTVIISGFSGILYEFIEGVYKEDTKDYFDIMAVHPYRYPKYPEDLSLYDDLQKLRGLMSKYGDEGKPVWITELGWPTHKNHTDVLVDVVRTGLKYLQPERVTWSLAIFDEPGYPSRVMLTENDLRNMVPGKVEVAYKDISGLVSISAEQYQVLMLPHDEYVPVDAFDFIEKYVREGGIVIFSQGVPMYYEAWKGEGGKWLTNNAGDSYRNRLHIGWEAWWTRDGIPKESKKLKINDKFTSTLPLKSNLPAVGRFFTDSRLKPGDIFVPIVQVSEGEYSGAAAAVIDLNSDLKGAVIVSSIDMNARGVDEKTQAEILPRAYMISMRSGIDSIFWYNLRARENDPFYNEDNFGIIHKDLSPKPAYYTMSALSKMVPAGSECLADGWHRDNIYYPGWKRPDGKNVYALWATKSSSEVSLQPKGNMVAVYNAYGKRIKIIPSELKLSTSPIYVLGPDTIEVQIK